MCFIYVQEDEQVVAYGFFFFWELYEAHGSPLQKTVTSTQQLYNVLRCRSVLPSGLGTFIHKAAERSIYRCPEKTM